MTTRKRRQRKYQNYDNFAENLLKMLFQVFILPLYRIPKYAIELQHSGIDTSNLIWDIIAMMFIFAFIAMLNWWTLLSIIAGYFILAIGIGIVRRNLRREKTSQPEIDKGYAEQLASNGYYKYQPEAENVEPIKARVENEFAREREQKQSAKNTTIKSNHNDKPDFDENDFEAWRNWIQEHPDQIRAQKR